MKFRSDFITNSSSGGFLNITLDNTKLADLIEEYQAENMIVILKNDKVSGRITLETDDWDEKAECPKTIEGVIKSFITIMKSYASIYDDFLKDNKYNLKSFTNVLAESEQELTRSFTNINWNSNPAIWGENLDDDSDGETEFIDKVFTFQDGQANYTTDGQGKYFEDNDDEKSEEKKERNRFQRYVSNARVNGWVNFNDNKKPIIIVNNSKSYKVINLTTKYLNYINIIINGISTGQIAVNKEIDQRDLESMQVISSDVDTAKKQIQIFQNVCNLLLKKENFGIIIDLVEKKNDGTFRKNKITKLCCSDFGMHTRLGETDVYVTQSVLIAKAISEDELKIGVSEERFTDFSGLLSEKIMTAQEMIDRLKIPN